MLPGLLRKDGADAAALGRCGRLWTLFLKEQYAWQTTGNIFRRCFARLPNMRWRTFFHRAEDTPIFARRPALSAIWVGRSMALCWTGCACGRRMRVQRAADMCLCLLWKDKWTNRSWSGMLRCTARGTTRCPSALKTASWRRLSRTASARSCSCSAKAGGGRRSPSSATSSSGCFSGSTGIFPGSLWRRRRSPAFPNLPVPAR